MPADAKTTDQADPKAATKPDWPKTPGGTIDWETVFEDPDGGILAQFQRVVTP